jgi:hypothetical protein
MQTIAPTLAPATATTAATIPTIRPIGISVDDEPPPWFPGSSKVDGGTAPPERPPGTDSVSEFDGIVVAAAVRVCDSTSECDALPAACNTGARGVIDSDNTPDICDGGADVPNACENNGISV